MNIAADEVVEVAVPNLFGDVASIFLTIIKKRSFVVFDLGTFRCVFGLQAGMGLHPNPDLKFW